MKHLRKFLEADTDRLDSLFDDEMLNLHNDSSKRENRISKKKLNDKSKINKVKLKENLDLLFTNKDKWTNVSNSQTSERIYDLILDYELEESNSESVLKLVDESFDTYGLYFIQKVGIFAKILKFILSIEDKIQELLDLSFRISYEQSYEFLLIELVDPDNNDISIDMFSDFFEALKSIQMRMDIGINEINLTYIKLELSYEVSK